MLVYQRVTSPEVTWTLRMSHFLDRKNAARTSTTADVGGHLCASERRQRLWRCRECLVPSCIIGTKGFNLKEIQKNHWTYWETWSFYHEMALAQNAGYPDPQKTFFWWGTLFMINHGILRSPILPTKKLWTVFHTFHDKTQTGAPHEYVSIGPLRMLRHLCLETCTCTLCLIMPDLVWDLLWFA